MIGQADFSAEFISCMKKNGLDEYGYLNERMYAFTRMLLEYNAHTNLTAITDPAEIIAKHYADSFAVCCHIPQNATLLDVGTGAGFPALPVAAARPDVTITALDSTSKKLAFIESAALKMELSNLSVLNMRAETAAHEIGYRERFTAVVSRAVARLNVLCELCLPFAAVGGKFIAMKGTGAIAEKDEALTSVRILGGAMTENITYDLAVQDEKQKRCVIIIQKNRPTPKNYPRNNAQINKKPL